MFSLCKLFNSIYLNLFAIASVSMGGYSARKALQVVANVERVIAIELLAACQAIEFLRPLKTVSCQ